ncbi:MAG TPA: enoyl-CoA hydratase-related protein [Lacibacter sp.]|nr:enoyl-CoA hydratase-related protein [Lacibacter sp.]
MNFQTLLTSFEDGIYIITINRPDKLNALNKTVIEELAVAIDEVYNNTAIKTAIITGAGPKAFVAGADISEFLSLDTNTGEALARKGQDQLFNKIEQSPKPIIAAVNGFALGGGCELAMSCHFRLANENVKFGQPEVNLGLIPGYGGTQRLTQLIGKGKAMELMMTAAMIDAHEAKQLGLVNYITTEDELMPKTKELLNVIMTKGPNAVGKVIKAVNAYFDKSQNGFDAEIKLFGQCFGTEEMKEGVSAFLEKRKADFHK